MARPQGRGFDRPLRRDAARNRERLLEAAVAVFAEQGLAGSVDDVARLAGVGMGTLYRRFPTKEALIDELVRELLSDVLEEARASLAEAAGRGLERFLSAVGTAQASRLGLLPRLWNTSEHAGILEAIRTATAELLADAQDHGQVRLDLRPEDVFTIMWSLRGVIETTRGVAPDAWRRHLEIILAGVRPSQGSLEHPPLDRTTFDQVVANLTVER